MGLMNGQAHGFFVMVQRRSADVHKGILIKQRNPYKTEESKLPHYSMEQ